MRSQQVLHLLEFPITPCLSSWLGGHVSFSFRTPVEGIQQGRGVGKIIRFLVISYQDRDQYPSCCMGMAPDFLVRWDVFLCTVH